MSAPTGEKLHVVLGYGQVGRPLTHLLAELGHRVRVVSRTRPERLPASVEHLAADISDRESAVAASHGASVVYHVAGAPYAQWPAVLPALADAAVMAAARTGAPLVYLDNLYAFGAPTGPIGPGSARDPVEAKGRLREELAQIVLRAAERGAVPGAAVAHASDFFGPGVANAVVAAMVFDAVRAGRAPRWPVTLDQPHALAYVPDVAATLAALGTRHADAAAGPQRWLVPADGARTGRETIELVTAAAGRPALRPSAIAPLLLRVAGAFNADARELAKLRHQWDRPWIVDDSRTRAELGVHPTPLEQAVAQTLATTGPVAPERGR